MQLRPKDNNKLKGQYELLFFVLKQKFRPVKQKNRVLKPIFEDVKQNLRQICKKQQKSTCIFS